MTSAGGSGGGWDRLLTERAAARAELVHALAQFDARMRDPLRLKETIRRHPLVAAGVAAGAGALLVRALLPAGERDSGVRERPAGDTAPSVFDDLRDAAIRAAAPMLAQFLEEHLGVGAEAPPPLDAEAERNGAVAGSPVP